MLRIFPFFKLLFCSIVLISIISCSEKRHYSVRIGFTDSTYFYEKDSYKAGDTVYVTGSEWYGAFMPDTVQFQITSKIGDIETIIAWFQTASSQHINTHSGCINSLSKTPPEVFNGILEVKGSGDFIKVYYEVKGQTAKDTALIIP